MKQGVSKKEFIKSLESTLKLTRKNIDRLELQDQDTVIIHYDKGYTKTVNIACNSAIAIMLDIARKI